MKMTTAVLMLILSGMVLASASDAVGTAAIEDRQIFLLIGQSNMAGRAAIEKEDEASIEGCELFNTSGEW